MGLLAFWTFLSFLQKLFSGVAFGNFEKIDLSGGVKRNRLRKTGTVAFTDLKSQKFQEQICWDIGSRLRGGGGVEPWPCHDRIARRRLGQINADWSRLARHGKKLQGATSCLLSARALARFCLKLFRLQRWRS